MTDPRRERRELSDAELDRLAEVSAEDIGRAQRRFREKASPRFKELLDAEPVDPADDAPATS